MNENDVSQSIVVVGRGSVTLVPDIAGLQTGLEVRAATPGEALSGVSSVATTVLDAAREQGLEDQDLRTQGLSVHPNWDNRSNRLVGYIATYSLALRIREIESARRIIDAVSVAAGEAFRLGGIDYEVSSTDAARKDASAKAIEDARNQAQALADAAGVRVGRVLSISELDVVSPRLFKAPVFHAAAVSAAGPPIESGGREVTVHVTVAFEIND